MKRIIHLTILLALLISCAQPRPGTQPSVVHADESSVANSSSMHEPPEQKAAELNAMPKEWTREQKEMMEQQEAQEKSEGQTESLKTVPSRQKTDSSPMEPGLVGGGKSRYYDWSKTKFDEATAQDKIIYLEFFASWCPICQQQQPELISGFTQLDNPNVIGFKIHFKDDETTDEMDGLARQYGIVYQHTKVVLKNGKVVLKNPEAWDSARFVAEMNHLG